MREQHLARRGVDQAEVTLPVIRAQLESPVGVGTCARSSTGAATFGNDESRSRTVVSSDTATVANLWTPA